uniref:CopG family transcriptional regulator n=1 Tax=Chlorobium chlorochromatii (strain CaD3) TaxID=340177 RepID=Q3AQZ7_CHLCH
MLQAKVSLSPPLYEFLKNYKDFGFKDKSSMVQNALERLKNELEVLKMQQSAQWYAELYDQDLETQELTESAITGWPE